MKRIFALVAFFAFVVPVLRAQTGTWSGKIDFQGTELPLVFHIEEDGATMDSPAQGVKGIPAEATLSGMGRVKLKVPSIGAAFEGLWVMKRIVGTFTQNGMSFPLTLTPGEAAELKRPQTPVGPFPYSEEELSFSSGDALLKGTLTLPEDYSRATPALIMVTGSGLQNRDEELFGHKPFAVIADALARRGIATLRYDDRGFGESTGDVVSCTTEDLKNDALSGIRTLRARFDKVGVLGHSEGGTIAFILAAEGQADFVVSLAGMTVSGRELLLRQNRSRISESFGEATAQTYCKLLEEAFDAAIAGTPLPSADGYALPHALKQNYRGVEMQLGSPYLKYFLRMDVRTILDRVVCPVLALNGTKDTQVDCRENLGALVPLLPANPLNVIEAVEGVNHLFQHCTAGSIAEYREIEETFAPEVLEKMSEWIISLKQ